MQLFFIAMNHSDFFKMLQNDAELNRTTLNMRACLSKYITDHRLNSLILGISGGIDSALCAALTKPVCDQLNIPLIGRSITIESNKKEEVERSLKIGTLFCHDFQHLDLTSTFYENKKLLIHFDDSALSKMRQGNMKARMRMMILYDLAQLYRGIVISTDNYTEYLTGFWTLHGDVGDYAPIINLWKSEVFFLSKFLLKECDKNQKIALQQCIDATPEDGLGISNSDCDQLGVENYFEADKILIEYFKGNKELENHILVKRYLNSDYKRKNPIYISRKDILK